MTELIIYGMGFAAVVIFLLALFSIFSRPSGGFNRLEGLSNASIATEGPSIIKSEGDEKLRRLLKPFRDRLEKEDANSKNKRVNLMHMAGFYNPNAFIILYLSRIGIAIALASFTVFILSIVKQNLSPETVFAGVIVITLIGYFFPFLYVKSRIAERQQQFREGLPDAMDMLLVSLEAGLSFPASLKHVAKETRDVHPILSEQFELVTLEFQAGRQRAEALKNLADRVDLPEVHGLTTMIIQSEELGTSLTSALRASAEDLRRDRMLKAETKANALPVKMSLPLVGCIFPTLFAIILVPVIVRIVRVL